nr:MAG TPA: hypothetical protein [Caudoviricetes sp.]
MSFLSHTLEISLIFIDLSLQAQFSVHYHLCHYAVRDEHSWMDYIYSPSTRCTIHKPFAIL